MTVYHLIEITDSWINGWIVNLHNCHHFHISRTIISSFSGWNFSPNQISNQSIFDRNEEKDGSTQTLPIGDGTLVEGSKDIVFAGVVLVIVVGKNNDNGRRDF